MAISSYNQLLLAATSLVYFPSLILIPLLSAPVPLPSSQVQHLALVVRWSLQFTLPGRLREEMRPAAGESRR